MPPDTPQAPSWDAAIPAIAQKQGIDPELIRRVIRAESAGNPSAVSPKGATGLMQLMPEVSKRYGVDPTDPIQNIGAGAAELKRLLGKYQGHYGRAVAAYNAGESAVDSAKGGIPNFPETRNYMMSVLNGYEPPEARRSKGVPYEQELKEMSPGWRSLEELYPGAHAAVSAATGISPAPKSNLSPWERAITIMTGSSGAGGELLKMLRQPTAPDYLLMPGESRAAIDPNRALTPLEQEKNPVLTGAGRFVAGTTTPENLAVMATMAPFGSLPGVARATGAGFAASQVADVARRGVPKDAAEATQSALQLGLGVLTGRSSMKGFEPQVPMTREAIMASLPQQPRTPMGPVTEVGPRTAPAPEPPKGMTLAAQPKPPVVEVLPPEPKSGPGTAPSEPAQIKTPSDVAGIIGNKAEGKLRPSGLEDRDLKTVAELNQAQALKAGLTRDDWLAARAEAKRRFAPEDAPQVTKAPPSPSETIHQGVTRVIKASDAPDAARRMNELVDSMRSVRNEPDETRARLADSLLQRAGVATQQAAEIQRVVGAKDFARELTALRHQSELVATGGPETEIDEATGKPVSQKFERRFPISGEERQYLGLLAGAQQGGWRLVRDESGKTLQLPKLSEAQQTERNAFVERLQGQLDAHVREVLAQGGRPSEAQKAEGLKLISGLQAATGKRFVAQPHTEGVPLKKQFEVDDQGVVRYPGVDPNQAYWNKIMGRPVTSHFAKPSEEQISRRVERLNKEAEISRSLAEHLHGTLPKDFSLAKPAPVEVKAPETAMPKPVPGGKVETIAERAGGALDWDRQVAHHTEQIALAKAISEHPKATDEDKARAKLIERESNEALSKMPSRIPKAPRTEPTGTEGAINALTLARKAAPQKPSEPEVPSEKARAAEELRDTQRHLINLHRKGLGESQAAKIARASIAELRKVAPDVETPAELEASEVLRASEKSKSRLVGKTEPGAPETPGYAGKADDLFALLQLGHEEIPRPLQSAIYKMHDLTPPEDKDYIASLILDAKGLGVPEMAARYGGALHVLREGLRANKGPLALHEATHFAKFGKRPMKNSPGEAGFIVPSFIPDILNELGRYASNVAVGAKDIFHFMTRWLTEGSYVRVSPQSRDAMFKFRGELNRIEDLGRIAFNDGIEATRRMPVAQQLQVMSDMQLGKPMPSPDLQGLRDILQQLEDKQWVEMQALRPGMNYLRDHLGSIWEKPPRHAPELFERHANVINRGMLQGNRGMFRQRVYQTVLDGIADGGVPITTNPFEMALLDLGRQAQYIYANSILFPNLKAQGRLVRGEEAVSKGLANGELQKPVRVPDNIIATWFPAETAKGDTVYAKGAPWYMEAGELKMLQNWLAPDAFRRNIVGKVILGFKNIYTPIELFGPFHLASIAAKSMALGVSQGMNRAYNVGVVQHDLGQAVQGLGEALKGLALPYTAYKNGRALREAAGQTLVAWQKYGYNRAQFLATPQGKLLAKSIPNIEETVDALLEAGVRLETNPAYATKWQASMVQSWYDRKFLKAGAVVPFAAIEKITGQLFQKYIPAVKLFATSKEISVELRRNAPRIQSGEITRGEVLHRAARRIDNILGELNWDNLNMSRGWKSFAQAVWRSPGWRLGTLSLVKNAGVGQARETFKAAKNRTTPQVDPNMLYIMASAAVGAALATVIMATFAKKAPSSVTDLTNPQTGQLDSRGKPIRLDMPLYTSRDIPEILTNPFGYATGGQSGVISKATEAIKNRTFQGTMVSEKRGWASVPGRVGHALIPQPFVYTGHERMTQQGFPSGEAWGLNFLGLNPSRRDLDLTPAEQVLTNIERKVTVLKSAEDQQRLQARQQIEAAYRNGRLNDAKEFMKKAIQSKVLDVDEAMNTIEEARKPYLQRLAESAAKTKGGGKALIEAYKAANESERRILMPLILDKLDEPGMPKELQKLRGTLSPIKFGEPRNDSKIVIEGVDVPRRQDFDRIKYDPFSPNYSHAAGAKERPRRG